MPHIQKKELLSGKISYRIYAKALDIRTRQWFQKSMTWRPPEDMPENISDYQVKVVAKEFEEKVRKQAKGLLAIDEKITFIDYSRQWLENIKLTRSMGYYLRGKDIINRMEEYFGQMRLCDVSPLFIQDFLNKTIAKGYKQKRAVLNNKNDLRRYIICNNYCINQIARDTGVGKHTFHSIRNGLPIVVSSAEKICHYLKIKLEDYFDVIDSSRQYAKETMQKIQRLMSAILATAKRKRIIEHNFATREYLEPIRGPKTEVKILSVEEAKKLYNYMETSDEPIRWKMAIYISLFLGLRRGEIAGLEWKDIDFENGIISIRRSVTDFGKNGKIVKEPKTEGSIRDLSIPPILIEKLQEYKKWWDETNEYVGGKWNKTDRVFCGFDGSDVSGHLFLTWLHKILDAADLPRVTLHSLRHTNITMQLVSGVDIKTVSARAGHARASTTTDIYSHYLKIPDIHASQIINDIFKDES